MPRLFPYIQIKNFLSGEHSTEILTYAIQNEKSFTHSTLGKENIVNTKRRISLVMRELENIEALMHKKINALYPDILQKLQMKGFKRKESLEIELAAHGDGAFFAPHVDILGDRSDRVLNAVYYLHNTPRKFIGGELKIYPFEMMPGNDLPAILEPVHNSLVVFQSYVLHEVLPVNCPGAEFKNYRFAINCWIHKA